MMYRKDVLGAVDPKAIPLRLDDLDQNNIPIELRGHSGTIIGQAGSCAGMI